MLKRIATKEYIVKPLMEKVKSFNPKKVGKAKDSNMFLMVLLFTC
jgi:hypothetical protein